MCLYIVTVEEPIYLKPFVEAVIRSYPVVGVAILRRSWIRPKGLLGALKEILVAVGLATILYHPSDLLRVVRYRLIDGLCLMIPLLHPRHSIATMAKDHGVPIYYTNDVNSDSFRAHLSARAPDVVIYQIPQIIKGPTLRVPRLGSINRHSGPASPIPWELPYLLGILRGERDFGVTIHWMNERLDDGRILDQVSFERRDGESLVSLYRCANQIGTGLMLQVLGGLKRKEWHDRPNVGQRVEVFRRPGLRDIVSYWKLRLSTRWSMREVTEPDSDFQRV